MLVFPALAFMNGAIELWTVFSLVLGFWLTWTIYAKRLRRYTIAAENSLTFPEFFEKRFGDKWGVLRTLSAVIALFFIIFYISSGLIAGSKLLNTVFGLDGIVGILVTLVAVASYTFIGGFLAVSRTDVFQALIMLAGFIILPLTLLFITSDPFQGLEGTAAGFWNPFTDAAGDGITVTFLLSSVGWGLGSFGSLRILQRFMAVESEKSIRPSRDIGTLWAALIFMFGLMLGLVALPALGEVGRLEVVTADPERLFLVAATVFFPPILAGILLSAVIAAVMSTADSQLLLASAVATDDLPLIRRYAYAKRYVFVLGAFARVWMGRFLLVVVGIVAAVLSISNPSSVLNLVSYAWGGMGAAFGPLILLALYWPPLQLLGSDGVDDLRHRGCFHLGLLLRWSRRNDGHRTGHPGLHHRHPRRRGRHPSDTPATRRDYGGVRRGKPVGLRTFRTLFTLVLKEKTRLTAGGSLFLPQRLKVSCPVP